jgi:Initiator Replication protein
VSSSNDFDTTSNDEPSSQGQSVGATPQVQSDSEFEVKSRLNQPSLFPDEDFIIPDSLRTFRKSHSMIQSIALNRSHTLNTRRLMDAASIIVQLECRKRGPEFIERIFKDRVSPMFETRVTELAALANIPGKNYVRLREDMRNLYEMDFAWNVMGDDGQIEWDARSHYLSYLAMGQGDKSSIIRFAMDPAILSLILEPKLWARFHLASKVGIGSSAAYALWQFAYRYLGNPSKVTAAIPVDTMIEMLVGPSKYVKRSDGKVTVAYGEFKRRCLNDAIARVNDIPSLTHKLELKEIYSGKRVAKLQLKFVPKLQAALDLAPLAWPKEVIDLLTSIGYTAEDQSILAQAHSFIVIADSIERLAGAEQRIRARGDAVFSRKALFDTILDNVAKGAALAEITDEAITTEARVRESERIALERNERMESAFSAHQRRVFNTNFSDSMSPAARDVLISKFLKSEGEKLSVLPLLSRGWSASNVGLMTIFRTWLQETDPESHNALLPAPEDRSIEAWKSWKLESSLPEA